MATKKEIWQALNWLGIIEVSCPHIILLKCTVDYPCSENNINLAGLDSLKDFYRTLGFSDHTKGYLAACMAVAIGASVIEKHFALNETAEAIGLSAFITYVQMIRKAERIMGSPELGTFECEEKWKKIARRGESGLRE